MNDNGRSAIHYGCITIDIEPECIFGVGIMVDDGVELSHRLACLPPCDRYLRYLGVSTNREKYATKEESEWHRDFNGLINLAIRLAVNKSDMDARDPRQVLGWFSYTLSFAILGVLFGHPSNHVVAIRVMSKFLSNALK